MPAGILYLEIDDEITSAAARIRRADGRRVAVVLPNGSRVATSRINFRLLARDALLHEKHLSIIAPDGATRALAASAGLPVFATVAEYEESLEVRRTAPPPPPGAASSGGELPEDGHPTGDGAAFEDTATAVSPTPVAPVPAAATPPARPVPREERPRPEVNREPERAGPAISIPAISIPAIGFGRRSVPRMPLLIGTAIVALALLVVGVGAYVLLPSATVVVTPHEQLVGPRSFAVIADTTVTEPDADAGVVPAELVPLEVTVDGSFEASGVRVEETRAEGRVTFTSFDTSGSNTIPAGSVIATEGGVRFRTLRAVTLERADIVPPTNVSPTTASVAVEAVTAGPAGNVFANAITLVPAGEDPVITKVRNTEATSGGTRTEFPRIEQADVDAAMAALREQLEAAFADQLADPSIAPPDATVFGDTAVLGEATPTVDPAGLVGLEQASFELGLTARGTVVAVDPEPVEAIARERLEALVAPGSEFVDGSISIEPGAPVVEGQQVSYPVTVSARQVSIPDAAELEALILGKPGDEARAILAPFGDVELTLWPDWVTSVPTIDGRVEVEVRSPLPVEVPDATPSPTPAPTAEPSATVSARPGSAPPSPSEAP